jgi:hypothetical protein
MKEKSLILVLDDDPDICIMIKMVLDYYGMMQWMQRMKKMQENYFIKSC